METRTAREADIEQLFHFQSFNVAYVEDVLLKHRIKLSDPRTFNDPWDCRPRFSTSLLDDPKIYVRHVEYLTELGRRKFDLAEPELKRRANKLRNDRPFMESLVHQMTADLHTAIANQYRVYCLSTGADNALMWAHYTKDHEGICLGFATASETFCGCLEVTYSETYPDIDLTTNDHAGFLRDTLLTKAACWSYEDEYRFLAKEGCTDQFIAARDGFVSFAPQDLRIVIAGCRMTDENLNSLRRIIKARKPCIPLFQAQPATDRYALHIEGIDA